MLPNIEGAGKAEYEDTTDLSDASSTGSVSEARQSARATIPSPKVGIRMLRIPLPAYIPGLTSSLTATSICSSLIPFGQLTSTHGHTAPPTTGAFVQG